MTATVETMPISVEQLIQDSDGMETVACDEASLAAGGLAAYTCNAPNGCILPTKCYKAGSCQY